MMKIDICNQEVTIRTMSDRAVKIAINKALRSIDGDAGKVISWEVKGNRLYFTHTFSGTRSWKIVKAWAQIIETAEVATEQVAEVATKQVAEVAEVIETAEVAEVIETAEVVYDAEVEAAIERMTSEAPKFYVQTLTTAIIVEADSADMAVVVAAQTLEKVGNRLEVSKAPSLSYGETVAYRAGHRALRSGERTVYWVQRA